MYYRILQQQQDLKIPVEYVNFINAFWYRMYKLAYLTRFYIVLRITGLGDPNVVLNELKKTSASFKGIAESLPGVTVPDEVLNLLTEYDIILADLVNSKIAGDQAKIDESIRRLYQLADELAAALSQYNPNWDKEELEKLYHTYFQKVVDEVNAVKAGEFNNALDLFNSMISTALELGDFYAEGFLKLAPPPTSGETISVGQYNMVRNIRQMMAEISYLTRFYMFSRIVNLYETDYIAQRLYAVPAMLNRKTEMILGYENSEGLLNLLSVYTIMLESVINSIMNDNFPMIEASMNNLYRYADQIAEYLASINPYWTKSKWKELLYTYNNHLIDEASAIQGKEYDESLFIYEDLLKSALAIADYFAQGLNQYFLANEPPPAS